MKEIHIKLYKANWCGYCIRFLPDWNKIIDLFGKEEIKKELEDKYKVKVFTYTYDDKENKDDLAAAGINSFPTIKYTIIDKKEKTLTLDDDKRELNIFIDTIFSEYPKDLKEKLKRDLIQFNSEKMSGGFFDYSQNKKNKYYKEYIKCRNLYLKLKK